MSLSWRKNKRFAINVRKLRFNKRKREYTMTIQEYFEKHPIHKTETVHRYAAANITFENNNGEEDEIQLNVTHSLKTKAGIQELAELFESLCDECETAKDNVLDVWIPVSATSEKALIEAGF